MATKMNCGALEDLVEHFNIRLEALRLGVELRDASEDDMCQSMLLSIQSELQQLSAILVLLKTEVAKFKEQLEETEVLKKSVVDLNSRLKYALENIPARLPRKQEQTPPQATNPAHEVTKNQVDVAEQCPLPPRQPVPSQPTARTHNKPSFCVQLVELLTVDDFNSAPKYMRGRLTYDQLNNTVEELNKAYTAKYKLLSKKRTKLSDPDRKKWEKFKSQENKDTAGHYFIVDDDVKTYTSLKIDNTFRNMMTVLRHCGRIKEIRGGGITRYAVLLVY